MKKTVVRTKNFVKRNQTKILVTVAVTATTVAVLEQIGIRSLNEFLKENNLYDTYYFVEE